MVRLMRWPLVFVGFVALVVVSTLELIFAFIGYLLRGRVWLRRFTSWH